MPRNKIKKKKLKKMKLNYKMKIKNYNNTQKL